jgi:hypothetical protein
MRDVADVVIVRPPRAARAAPIVAGLAIVAGSAGSGSLSAIFLAVAMCAVLVRWSGVAVSASVDGVVVRNTWRTVRTPWEQVEGWLILGNGVALVRKGTERQRPLQVSAVRAMHLSPERRFDALQSIIEKLGSVKP